MSARAAGPGFPTFVARSVLAGAALLASAAGCGDDVRVEDGTGGGGTGGGATSTGSPTSTSTSTASGSSTASASSGDTTSTGGLTCNPGDQRCNDDGEVEACPEDGSGFVVVETCEAGFQCVFGECADDCTAAGVASTHVGCSFWAADLDQQDGGGNDPASAPWGLLVGAVGDTAAEILVEVNDAAPGDPVDLVAVAQVTVQPGDFAEVELPTRELDCGTQPNDYASPGTCLSSRAFRVTSSAPIVALQLNALENVFSNDASLLLPAHALSSTYRVLGWQAGHPIDPGFPGVGVDRSYVTVIGTEADTEVTVSSSWRIVGNPPIDAVDAGGSITVTLQPFDVLNLETDDGTDEDDLATIADLSGSMVVADKRVVVFSGTESAAAPGSALEDFPTYPGWDGDTGFLDHLEEQLLPVAATGKAYVVTRSPVRSDAGWREADVIRFVGVQDTTVTTSLPPPWDSFTLAAGEVKTTWAQDNFVASAEGSFVVGQILAGQAYATRPIGDPSLIVVPTVDLYQAAHPVLVPFGWEETWLVLAAETGVEVTIDGAPPRDCVVEEAGAVSERTFESRACRVAPGLHRLASEAPFGVLGYGYGASGSIAYVGGTAIFNVQEPTD